MSNRGAERRRLASLGAARHFRVRCEPGINFTNYLLTFEEAAITVFKLYFTFIWDEYVTEDQFILSGVKLMYLHDSCCSVFVPSSLNALNVSRYGLECFNGILGKFNNNNKTIEVQIMRQFQQSQQLSMPWTCKYGAEFFPVVWEDKWLEL